MLDNLKTLEEREIGINKLKQSFKNSKMLEKKA